MSIGISFSTMPARHSTYWAPMPAHDTHALHDDLPSGGKHLDDASHLALLLTGNHDDLVVLADPALVVACSHG